MGIRKFFARRLKLAAVMAGFIASGSMMYAASYSTFTSTASNPGDQWAAGTVVLADDDSAKAMFAIGNSAAGRIDTAAMKPSQAVVNCIQVTYTGTLASTVKLYVTSPSETLGTTTAGNTGLLAYLHVKIEEGTGGGFGSCGAFTPSTTLWDTGTHGGVGSDLLSVFPITRATGPSSATASWTNSTTKVYRFTVTMDASTPDSSQGATATATFNWEANNS
jgi:hypothetical protein